MCVCIVYAWTNSSCQPPIPGSRWDDDPACDATRFFYLYIQQLTLQRFYIHGSASQCGWISDVISSSVRGLIALWSRSAVAQSKAASNQTKKAMGCHLKFLSYRCSKGGHSELLVDFFQGLSLRTLCVWTTMEGVDLGRDSDRMGSAEESSFRELSGSGLESELDSDSR